MDVDVKNGATLLDRLIKDIVTESESFDIENFIPLLQKHIKKPKPYIRQLLVGWIMVLNAVPGINMLDYLPEFLDGLFNMLSDGNREIRQAADNALSEFLREIKEADVIEFGPMVHILVSSYHTDYFLCVRFSLSGRSKQIKRKVQQTHCYVLDSRVYQFGRGEIGIFLRQRAGKYNVLHFRF